MINEQEKSIIDNCIKNICNRELTKMKFFDNEKGDGGKDTYLKTADIMDHISCMIKGLKDLNRNNKE